MPARFFVDMPFAAGAEFDLPPGPARHAQVLRLQPGAAMVLFDGQGGEYDATVADMSRGRVGVRVGVQRAVERELSRPVTLAIGMPANERMDALVEKATELGAAHIVPLVCERSVLRLQGERAQKKRRHWRGVAIAAAEQCGRTRLPQVHAVASMVDWLHALPPAPRAARWLLDPEAATSLAQAIALLSSDMPVVVLSGPEGGVAAAERKLALAAGFVCVGLGPRVLRADTAPLAVLACLSASGV